MVFGLGRRHPKRAAGILTPLPTTASNRQVPRSLRREHFALYALLTSLTAISIDAILPGLRGIDAEFSVSSGLSSAHLISLFVLGMVFGELLLGPISDAIGRKKALLIGLVIYAIGTIIAAVAGSIEMLVIGRFLQGVGVSGPKIATRAMIRDQFEGDAMARIMSFIFTLFIFVPLIAPALGQAVIALRGWRSLFVFYIVMAAVLGAWVMWRQPETLPADKRIPLRPRILVQNSLRILASRRVSLLIVATGFVFGAQLLYLSTAAKLFFDVWNIETTFPIYFAALASGIGAASYLNGKLVLRLGMDVMARGAFLGLALVGGLMLGAAAFWDGHPPLAVFMGLGFAAFFAIGILFGNLNAMALRSLGALAGLGASLIASGSSLIATIIAVSFGAFYAGDIYYLASAYLCAGTGAFALCEVALRGNSNPITPVR